MNSEIPNSPLHDPDWWRGLPWWKILGIALVNAFKSPGKRWWIQWAIAILVFGSLTMAAVLYCYFFPDSPLPKPDANH
jgi:hypothetical protein